MLAEVLVPCGFVLCVACGYAYHDPSLPALFFGLLSEPWLAAVLVINGLGHRSPRTREKFGRFIYSNFVLEPWWTALGPLTALPL